MVQCAAHERPLIGITPRYAKGQVDEYGNTRSDDELMAKVFTDSIYAAGGMPVLLPLICDGELQDRMVERCDGFAIPGGPDVDPAYWGVEGYNEELLCHERDAFELPLVRRIIKADKPLFTTCRGTQLLNVALGGTLCMDVPNYPCPEGVQRANHNNCLSMLAHTIHVEQDSLLCQSLGEPGEIIEVNSWHHCCVDKLGDGLKLTARSTDGVPEAIERPENRFVLGVQWHPEYTWQLCDYDFNLWKAFVEASKAC